ncbi:hypothetical protein ACEQPO_26745 [Bacillus sp. SL00103]
MTINEVAALCRCFKNQLYPDISMAEQMKFRLKRSKNQKAIEELHYRPSQLAQGLKVRKARSLGLL